MNHEIWKRVEITDENTTGSSWEQVPGALMWASVAETNDYWGVDEAYDVWWHQDGQVSEHPNVQIWDLVGPKNVHQMVQLDVGRDGKVWGTDGNQLFWRAGITKTEIAGTSWEIIESAPVRNVAHCTNGLVYVVNHENRIQYRVEGNTQNEFKGTGWASFSDVTNAQQVTCGLNGELLYVNTEGNVFFRDGVSYSSPHGTNWQQVELTESAVHVSAGETGQVWVLYGSGNAVILDKPTDAEGNYVDMSGDASSYELLETERLENTGLVQLDVGQWQVWGVNKHNEVFVRFTAQNEIAGTKWEQVQGAMIYVSTAEEGIVWAIDDDHDVWVLKTGKITVEEQIHNDEWWTPVTDHKLVYVDVGRQGQLVGLKDSGCSFWRKGITVQQPMGEGWLDLTNDNQNQDTYFKFNTIAMCATGNMFATLKSGDSKLYFRGGVSTGFAESSTKFAAGAEWFQSQVDMGENIRQVSCGYRGYVWAVSATGKVFRLDGVTADRPQGDSWTDMQRSGMSHVSVGDNGAVWANDLNGDVYMVGDNENQSWTQIEGSLVQLDVGTERVVGVNNWGEIFFRSSSASTPSKWIQINGHLKQVTTSQNFVTWGVDVQNNLWYHKEHPDQPIAPPQHPEFWIHVPYTAERMTDLDVGRDGIVWGCTASRKPVVRTGITKDSISGSAWVTEPTSQQCASIAVCTSGHVWAVTPDHEVVFRTGIMASSMDQNLLGTGWESQNPTTIRVEEVACGGNRQVWMTDVDGKLYHKTNTQDLYRPEGDLEPVLVDSGSWSYISVAENGQVFGLRGSTACARIGYSDQNPTGTGWNEFDTTNTIKNFNAGNNEIWMVNVHNEVFQIVDYTKGFEWTQVAGEQSYVSTAEEGVVWAIDVDGEVWRWKGGEISIEEIVSNVVHDWIHVPAKQLIRVDVGFNSQVVGIEENSGNALFRTGIAHGTSMGTEWAVLDSGFTDITVCATGHIWATNGETVSFRAGIEGSHEGHLERSMGVSWLTVGDMAATSINCGQRGQIWVTTTSGEVQVRENVNSFNWQGDGWKVLDLPQVGGEDVQMLQISAGLDGHATGVGADGQIYMRVGKTDENHFGTSWKAMTDGSTGARFRQVSRGEC